MNIINPEQSAHFADNMLIAYGTIGAIERIDLYIKSECSNESKEMFLAVKQKIHELINLYIYVSDPITRVNEMLQDCKDIITVKDLIRHCAKNDQDVNFRIIGTGETMKCGYYWKTCLNIAECFNPETIVNKDPTEQAHQSIKDFFKYPVFLVVKGLFSILFISLFSIAFAKQDAYILMQSMACLFAAIVVHFFSIYIKNTFNEK